LGTRLLREAVPLKDGRAIVVTALRKPGGWISVDVHLEETHVGWAELLLKKGSLVGHSLWVRPDLRRLGIATAIYNVVETEMGQITPSPQGLTRLGRQFWRQRLGKKAELDMESGTE